MGRIRKTLSYLAVPIGVFAIQACSGLGFQGGSIPTTFTGISSIQAVSPVSIDLKWSIYPGAIKYNIYAPNVNDPIATPGYNDYLFKPVPSDPTITYQYSVTAVDPATGVEQGDRTLYQSVQLLPHFNYKNTGSVTAASNHSIHVVWPSYPAVTYQVYVGERSPTGTVAYQSFVSANTTVTGSGSAIVSNLLEGHEYCTIVVATYSDQTNDGPDGVPFNGEVSTHLSASAYMVGASGNFGDSLIAQSQKCVRTQSAFSVASLRIYTEKSSLSSTPVFYVNVPGDTSEDTTGSVSTTIYQINETTGLSSVVGTRVGTGRVTAQSAIASGRYHFFAIVQDLSSPAQAQVEINVGPNGLPPTGAVDRPWVYVRAFNNLETPTATTGYYPAKQQSGFGAQHEGTSVAIGDFNCDGKKDLAIGIPDASIMSNDNRPAKSGRVIIYYDMSTATPATSTRTQAITFDITSFAGDSGRDLRLGTSLYVGNFNNDTQATNQFGGSAKSSAYQCDDLAIGSGYGPMFVLYGKRDVGAGDGGLNWVSPTAYTVNPSSSCDPSSNICQVGVYTQGNNYNWGVGLQMTSGDYNGDGYEDLAVTTNGNNGTGGQIIPHGIWVLRGSEYGLIAPNSYTDTYETVASSSGPYLSYPFIPYSKVSTAFPAPTPPANWGSYAGIYFASSLGTLHNAYYDTDSGKTKGSKRIRDVLLVGSPNQNVAGVAVGAVNACIPKSDYTAASFGTIGSATDVNSNFMWDCSQYLPAAPLSSSNFGTAMTSMKNPLRYRPDQFTDTGCPEGFGNCSSSSINLGYPGAVAIGAPGDGVYVYYGVNSPADYTLSGTGITDRDTLGIERNQYLTQLLTSTGSLTYTGATLAVTTGDACATSGVHETCSIQKIVPPTLPADQSFGYTLAALSGNIAPDTAHAKDEILAVGAPYKNYSLTGGQSFYSVGSVQLYLQNSQFDTNPIQVRPSSNSATPCDNLGVCRFANGFSNSLTSSLDYDGVLTNNVNFGLGGIAGGPLFSTGTTYNTNTDIVVGAPGHVSHPAVPGGTPAYVVDNGAALTFFSHGGTYRNYENTDATTNASTWHILDQSFSQESDMKYHQAISLGDIDQDGLGDVAVRVNQGSRNFIQIYHGSASKVGFDTSAGAVTNFSVQGDSSAGIRFAPVGNISNTNVQSYFVTGQNASYLIFDGVGGLVQGFPTSFATGGIPRKIYSPAYAYTGSTHFPAGIPYLNLADQFLYNSETSGLLDSTLRPYANIVHGDFNGDGYEDFAIGVDVNASIADETVSKGCVSNFCGSTGYGRVFVFYGGADNGFQTQPDTAGGYPYDNNYFSDYSADFASHTYFGAPCSSTGTGCKIQMIHEGTTTNLTTKTATFGTSMAAVPAGNCSDSSGNLHPVSALVVQGTTQAAGTSLWTYRPKCLSSPANFSGLISYADGTTAPSTLQVPGGSSATIGQTMIGAAKLMGANPANPNVVSHLVVTDQSMSRVVVYPVLSYNSDSAHPNTSFEVPTANTAYATDTTFTANGGRLIDYSGSAMMNGTNGNSAGFGNGLAAIGDVNGDGFNDVGVAITSLNRKDTASQVINQGTVLVLFGGANGLQTHMNGGYLSATEPSRTASCYIAPVSNVVTSTCNPTMLYLPEPTNSIRNGAYERTYLSPYSTVATSTASNEAQGTFLIGIPGRDSLDDDPSKRILQVGAFYVLP